MLLIQLTFLLLVEWPEVALFDNADLFVTANALWVPLPATRGRQYSLDTTAEVESNELHLLALL